LLAAGCSLLASASWAAKLGDPAAPLAIKEWVKGNPVDVKDGKNIYVVEFWATWCPPCRRSIPHLTEIQKKFKDKGVVVVGVSDEAPATVKPFVQKMAGQMDYTVAIDDGRKSNRGYMLAYGQNGIPHSFIVGKDGKVVWEGHPMDGLDEALARLVATGQTKPGAK
jgi:thiol-disulfide isomerase/thioredoxin